MKTMLALFFAFIATTAHADEWTGKDKTQHAIVGAVTASVVTLITEDPVYGCAAATALGFVKEAYDSRHRATHTASFKDFAVTAAAGCVAAKGVSILIGPKSVQVGYSWRF
jgi:uncharacterized protein YfiM (DUF2279 family)